MKKPSNAGKVNEFGKKTVSLKLYKKEYILLSRTKFNYFKNITIKNILMQKKFLCTTFLIFRLTKKVGGNSNFEKFWKISLSSLSYIYIVNNTSRNLSYYNIYIYIHDHHKKKKEIYIPFPGGSNSKEENYTKLNIANSIQYKPPKSYISNCQ